MSIEFFTFKCSSRVAVSVLAALMLFIRQRQALALDFKLTSYRTGRCPAVSRCWPITARADFSRSGGLAGSVARRCRFAGRRGTRHRPQTGSHHQWRSAGKFAVIIGTLGKSPLIDGLVKSGKLNADAISGKWESFIITTVANPLPGVDQALVIAGSDKRGTIYGIYEISEQIGVSPWYWWADVPSKHHENLFIKAGTYIQGPPVVKYRGIFINERPRVFGGWATAEFGGINSGSIRTCSNCCCVCAPIISGPPCGTTPSTRTTRSTPCWPTNTASSWAPRITSR